MDDVAKKAKPKDVVLPVTPEWQQRVLDALARSPRGEHARLAEAIDCSTGTLTELLSPSREDRPSERRYSKYVEPINRYFRWPSMMPLSPDSAEMRHIIEGLSPKQLELVRRLEGQSDEVVDAMLVLVQSRSKPETK